ncbi:hypothetical protein LIPSTDRAFT_75689 [Lipomyces starkeyi NRRL Y-11557]|uniref:Uncharacterized protein n=1 Tax=Lipomyces starkeyi NRRL Y-11557 TaxID=675824 RepID=A0A1E3PXC2_LIPST|nr:hypothetical protein LIPSTDRAFT_75689 [Lipomyces starkeyi NRRL Y-11557]
MTDLVRHSRSTQCIRKGYLVSSVMCTKSIRLTDHMRNLLPSGLLPTREKKLLTICGRVPQNSSILHIVIISKVHILPSLMFHAFVPLRVLF